MMLFQQEKKVIPNMAALAQELCKSYLVKIKFKGYSPVPAFLLYPKDP